VKRELHSQQLDTWLLLSIFFFGIVAVMRQALYHKDALFRFWVDKDNFWKYLTRQMKGKEKYKVERHLVVCDCCRTILAEVVRNNPC